MQAHIIVSAILIIPVHIVESPQQIFHPFRMNRRTRIVTQRGGYTSQSSTGGRQPRY